MNLIRSLKIVCLGLIIPLAILTSCSQGEDNLSNNGEIHLSIDPQNLPAFSQFSEIAKSLRIIPLETDKNCLIGHISRVFVGKEHIIISAASGSMEWKLFHFSIDGKFLNQIGKQGKGPGEYSDLWELTVFEDSQIIYAGTPCRLFQ